MIRVVRGDIAQQQVDGLIRPVRSDMAPVSALSRDLGIAAGEELEERIGRMGLLPVGGAVLTPAGRLPAGFLIHVVVMSEEEPQSTWTIQRALRNGLRRAADWELESVALPPLGITAGTIDPEESARTLVEILFNHVDEGIPPLDLSVVVSSDFEGSLFGGLVEEMARRRSSVRN